MLKVYNGKLINCKTFAIRFGGYNPVNYKLKKRFFKMRIGNYNIFNWRKVVSLTIKK